MAKTRADLVKMKTGFNQIRNSIYWLQRFMQQNHFNDPAINQRLMQMGANIGASYVNEYQPSSNQLISTLEEIYRTTVNSKVQITHSGNEIRVIDTKCACCKYEYSDISVPGCTLEVGMVKEMLLRLGHKIGEAKVIESKTNGHEQCVHIYQLED